MSEEKRYPRVRMKESDFPDNIPSGLCNEFLEVVNDQGGIIGCFFMPKDFTRKIFRTFEDFKSHYWAVCQMCEPEAALELMSQDQIMYYSEYFNGEDVEYFSDPSKLELVNTHPELFYVIRDGDERWVERSWRVSFDGGDYDIVAFFINGADAFVPITEFHQNLEGDPTFLLDNKIRNEDGEALSFFDCNEIDDLFDALQSYDSENGLVKQLFEVSKTSFVGEYNMDYIIKFAPLAFRADNIDQFIEEAIKLGRVEVAAFLIEYKNKHFNIAPDKYEL